MTEIGGTEPGGWESALLQQLRELGERADPVPAGVLVAARESYAWRNVDAELAELVYDSLLEASAAGVRSEETVRLVTFRAPALTVELEVTVDGRWAEIVGQLVPARAARVEARWQGGRAETETDGLGQFDMRGLPCGPLSLRCHLAGDGATVDTGWLAL